MDVNAYLRRINNERTSTSDFEFLSHLQKQHMFTVPFENLDVMNKKEITLDLDLLYSKIVVQNRGGFCYELNGLFHWLLQELGYEVHMISGQVASSENKFGPEFDHMALLVHLDRDYIVDVGFGDSIRSPLPLTGEEVTDVSGTYRIKEHPNESNSYLFQKRKESMWVSEFKFTTAPRQLSDFKEMCWYQQHSPESHFTKNSITSLATKNGRISLSGEYLIITELGRKQKILLTSSNDREQVLKDYFGIL